MKIQVCDICLDLHINSIFLKNGTRPDAAGGRSEDTGESFDLCHNHTVFLVNLLLEKSTEKANQKIIDRLQKHVKENESKYTYKTKKFKL